MAQQSARRGRKNQAYSSCLEHAFMIWFRSANSHTGPQLHRCTIRGRTDGSIRLRADLPQKSLASRGGPQMSTRPNIAFFLPIRLIMILRVLMFSNWEVFVKTKLAAIIFGLATMITSPISAAQWTTYDARGRVTTANDSCKGGNYTTCIGCCHQIKASDGQRKWSDRQCAGYCSTQPK
jgi:hypothetical protein